MNYLDQSLGHLARRIPGATRLFGDHRLDFCCAGNRTLRTAAHAAGIDARPIAAGTPSSSPSSTAAPRRTATGARPPTPSWSITSSPATTRCTASNCRS